MLVEIFPDLSCSSGDCVLTAECGFSSLVRVLLTLTTQFAPLVLPGLASFPSVFTSSWQTDSIYPSES